MLQSGHDVKTRPKQKANFRYTIADRGVHRDPQPTPRTTATTSPRGWTPEAGMNSILKKKEIWKKKTGLKSHLSLSSYLTRTNQTYSLSLSLISHEKQQQPPEPLPRPAAVTSARADCRDPRPAPSPAAPLPKPQKPEISTNLQISSQEP